METDLLELCEQLGEAGFLHQSGADWHWIDEAYPADTISLRSVTSDNFVIKLRVSDMVVRRLIAQKSLPAKQIVKFAPWMIERAHLELAAVRKEIRRVHEGRRTGWAVSEKQSGLFADSHEA